MVLSKQRNHFAGGATQMSRSRPRAQSNAPTDARSENLPSKRPYVSPMLSTLGTVSELTGGPPIGSNTDADQSAKDAT